MLYCRGWAGTVVTTNRNTTEAHVIVICRNPVPLTHALFPGTSPKRLFTGNARCTCDGDCHTNEQQSGRAQTRTTGPSVGLFAIRRVLHLICFSSASVISVIAEQFFRACANRL